MKGTIPAHIQSISISPIKNESSEFAVADLLGESINQQMIEENILKLVGQGNAHSQLDIIITSVMDLPYTYSLNTAEKEHVDFAFRWFRTVGDWDVAVSDFYGTSREARLMPQIGMTGVHSLRPHYDIIHQIGAEVQYTKDAWLWKFEGISRTGHGDQFYAGVVGFEYTLYQVFESNADLGLLLEYQFDDRDDDGSAPFVVSDNDIFAGARLALNDEASTAILAGGLFDVDNHTIAALVEAEHRLSDGWKAEFEARLFLHADNEDPMFAVHKDDSINFRLKYSF